MNMNRSTYIMKVMNPEEALRKLACEVTFVSKISDTEYLVDATELGKMLLSSLGFISLSEVVEAE